MSRLSKESKSYLFWRLVIPYIIHAVQVICPTVVQPTIQPTHVIFVQFIQHVFSQRSGRLLLVVLVAVHQLHRNKAQSDPLFCSTVRPFVLQHSQALSSAAQSGPFFCSTVRPTVLQQSGPLFCSTVRPTVLQHSQTHCSAAQSDPLFCSTVRPTVLQHSQTHCSAAQSGPLFCSTIRPTVLQHSQTHCSAAVRPTVLQLSDSQSCSLHALSVQCTLYTADTTCNAVVRSVLQHVTPCTVYIGTNILHKPATPTSGWKIEQTPKEGGSIFA